MSDLIEEDEVTSSEPSSLREIRRRQKVASRASLLARISALHRSINKPLADVLRDHALPLLPALSLLRFTSVSKSWAHTISSPAFANLHSSSHRLISGLFYRRPHLLHPSFAPFPPKNAHNLPPRPVPFDYDLPFLLTALSSCNGLLLLHREDGALIVCNPVSAEGFVTIPRPPVGVLEVDCEALIVYKTGPFNLRPDYFVVAPFRIDGSGLYGFQCFSSAAGAWWVSDAVCAAEELDGGSGVVAGGVAYWKTTMQSMVGFEPATDSVREVAWPMNYELNVEWRIGCAVDRLYATATTAMGVFAFRLLDDLDGWLFVWEAAIGEGCERCDFVGDGSFVFRRKPVLLGFQSGELEFLFMVDGRVVGVDIARRRVRWIEDEGIGKGNYRRFVSHINTFASVVALDVDVEDENFRVKEEESEEKLCALSFRGKEEKKEKEDEDLEEEVSYSDRATEKHQKTD